MAGLSTVFAKVRGMIHDGIVKIAKTTTKAIQVQVQVDDDYTDDEVPLLQMQGVRFKPPPGAELVMLCINGDPARPVGIVAVHRDTCPTDDLEDGEGGLYINGNWLAFAASDETLSLGAKNASDQVPLASAVNAEIDAIKAALDAFAGIAPVPNDGGAAIHGAFVTAWGTPPTPATDVGSSKVKVEP
ncbi:MAG: phage baseplate assembly protein [Deltaproteobacteria bacterium]|nr:phage baseplate assembly protein [Deltaproteobacteria bacterium]